MGDVLLDIPIGRIKPNPKQPRTEFDPSDLADLAASIRENGVIQPVKVFKSDAGEFTLIAGERRTRAAGLAGLTTVPAIVTERPSDEDLEDEAIAENLQRKDLSVAELARAFARLRGERGLTDEAIAKRFGKSRPYVTNIRLMAEDLPDEVLDMVGGGKGQIPQEHARALRLVAGAIKQSDLLSAAKELAEIAADDESTDMPEDVIGRLIDDVATELPDVEQCWPLTWPEAGVQATDELSVPPCQGCEFYLFVKSSFQENRRCCTRPECLDWKKEQWPAAALQRCIQQTGIAVAGADETVYPIKFTHENLDKIKRWLNKPPKHLRVMPGDPTDYHTRFQRARMLGSSLLTLGTIERSVIEETQAGTGKKVEAVLPASGESDADKQKRLAAEHKEYLARRNERAAKRRAVADVDWLGLNVIGLVAPQIEASGVTLRLMATFVDSHDSPYGWEVLRDRREAIRKQAASVSETVREALLRELIVVDVLGDAVCEDYDAHWRENYTRVHGAVLRVITNVPTTGSSLTSLGLTLPDGWDAVPVHRTASNCWVCGQFTPGDEISKRDREEFGWATADDGTVTCSDECRETWAKSAKSAPVAKSKAKKGKK